MNCNNAAAAAADAGALQWGLKRTHKCMGESSRSPSPWRCLLSTAPKNVFGGRKVHFRLNWPT